MLKTLRNQYLTYFSTINNVIALRENFNLMFKKLLLATLLLTSVQLHAQNRYVVYLKDKNNTPFSLSNPSAFLTQRAIDRRAKQNIAIDSLDLPVNQTYIQAVAATGATVLNVSKWLNTITFETTDPLIYAAVVALPFVNNGLTVGKQAAPLTTIDKFGEFKPNALPLLSANKTTSLDYGAAYHQLKMLNGDALHDAGFSGEGMLIAVMDAGFLNANANPVFDSLFIQNKIVSTVDFVDHDGDVYNDHWHGAMCFSIMGANSPGNIIGTCPQANYILLRTEDINSENIIEEYNWATAAEYADSMGTDLFSTSLGYTLFDDPAQSHTYATLDGQTAPMTLAADIAVSRGIIVINSAGNEGNNSWNYISVPSDAKTILAIGAVDSLENYASFSGNGPTFDGRVKPDVAALGQGTYYSSPFDYLTYSGNGTSFSGPVLAGLSACLWQKFPQLTALQIMQAIRQSASQFTNPDTLLGFGIPDFSVAATLLSVNETTQKESNAVVVFPNPVVNNLSVNTSKFMIGDAVTVTIYDVIGNKNFHADFVITNSQLNFSVQNLPSGVYFIKLSQHNKIAHGKFIKVQ